MSGKVDGQYITLKSSATLTQYRTVKIDANGELASPADNEQIIGVIQRDAVADEYVTVRCKGPGIHLCYCDEAVDAGDLLYEGTAGLTDTAGTNDPVAIALETNAAAGVNRIVWL